MKRKMKMIITAFAVCAVSAMAAMFTGCSMIDKIKEKIEQARCEHEWNDGEETKAATCTEVGELTKTCTLCNKVETEEIPLIEHTEVIVAAVAATCTEDGLTDGVKCSVCDTVIVKQVKISALGHLEVTDAAVAATCMTSGKTEGSHCSRCNEVVITQETIPATGHNIVTIAGKAATCKETGLTDGQFCETCGTVFASQEELAISAHVDENADDICDVCDTVLNIVAAEAGERVAGNTYRVYFSELSAGTYCFIRLSCDDSTYFMIPSNVAANKYLWWSGDSGPLYYLEGLEVVKTDTYIEFTLQAGTYKILKNDGTDTGDTYVIDELTTLETIDGIYRVVESDV